MKRQIHITFLALFFILLTGNLVQTSACMCGKASTCEYYNYAAVVFVGTAAKIEQEKRGNFKTEWTTFEMKESFLGEKKEIKIQNKTGFGCDVEFEKGKTYLIFAGQTEDGSFITSFCSGNLPLDFAATEIAELRKIKASPETGKLTGLIMENFRKREVRLDRVPLPNVPLNIQETETGKKYKTISGTDGRYEITVPPGKYKVEPLIPDYAKLNVFFEKDKIYPVKPRGCSEGFYVFSNKSRISGKLKDSEGKPVEDMVVELLSKDSTEKPFRGEMNDHTEKDGSFEITDIPVGKYTLSVNYTTPPEGDDSFPPVFFPNSSSFAEAQAIEIDLGTQISDLEFKLPTRLAKKEISGKVFWEDGSPAQNAELSLTDDEFPDRRVGCMLKTVSKETFPGNPKISSVSLALVGCDSKTDASGRFSLNGFSTRKYRVKAEATKNITGQAVSYEAESDVFSVDEKLIELKLVLKKKVRN